MNMRKKIENYLDYALDFDVSPFESIDGFHIRDRIQENYDDLTEEEKQLLAEYDEIVKDNAAAIYEHLEKAFDFEGEKPSEGWWWRIDEFAEKEKNDQTNGLYA